MDLGKPRLNRQNPSGSRQNQAESASPGRDPTVNHHAPRLDRDQSPLPTTTPRSRSEPVTNKPNEELEMGVSGFAEQSPKLRNLWVSGEHNRGESIEEIKKTVLGEQNRGETMWAMEFRESRGENEMKREKEIG